MSVTYKSNDERSLCNSCRFSGDRPQIRAEENRSSFATGRCAKRTTKEMGKMSLARFAGPLVTAGSVVLATSALAQDAHMDNGMMNVPTGTTQIAGSNRHEMDDHEMQMQSRLGIGMIPREHQLHMAGRQAMLTQKMSKELLLVALDVDRQRNLVSLRTSRHMFDETLEGLRYGNETLMLMKTTQEPVLDQLTRVDHIWPLFDAATFMRSFRAVVGSIECRPAG